MDLKELSSLLTPGKVRQQLIDSLRIAVNPRRFLRLVGSESPEETWTRLTTLTICFAVAEIAAFSLASSTTGDWNIPLVLGLAMAEVVLSSGLIPAFYFVSRFLSLPAPFRTTVAYTLTFRFVVLTIPMVLMGLFLASEDYAFALLKGVAVYAFFIGIVLTLPVAGASSGRIRLAAVCLSLVLTSATIALAEAIPDEYFRGGSPGLYTLLADPIGKEISEARLNMEYVGKGSALAAFYQADDAVAKSKVQGDTLLIGVHGIEQQMQTWVSWPSQYPNLDSAWVKEIARLSHIDSTDRFTTTKELARRNVAVIEAARTAGRAIVAYRQHVDVETMRRVFATHDSLLRSEIAGYTAWNANLLIRRKLTRLGLLECGCEPQ